jgi:protein-S-isoprenylcysteine O-methyltransferase Ste14
MNKIIKFLIALVAVITCVPVFGQNEEVPMADNLRSEGKIYVVVIMILIVLAGLIFYLFLMDRKVKRLEKLVSEKKKQTK